MSSWFVTLSSDLHVTFTFFTCSLGKIGPSPKQLRRYGVQYVLTTYGRRGGDTADQRRFMWVPGAEMMPSFVSVFDAREDRCLLYSVRELLEATPEAKTTLTKPHFPHIYSQVGSMSWRLGSCPESEPIR
ncbi:hypothetical protein Q7C36_001443 [Tachysurus vachellii]|uniref:Uncharacterized protein n=1 Tax=Tachysurus vachellii TaxID=175792 RepID=A0AA88NXS1_TACVA|nr:hypothetical protein Q7C36_001443 [Tachysurus vachellii]